MDISSILSSLSPEDISSLKSTAETLFGGGKGEPGLLLSGETQSDQQLFDIVSKVSSAMSRNDEKTEFIKALKPFLGDVRKKKADEAVTFIRLMSLMNVMKADGGRNNADEH